jgi:hypothetical protein
MGSERLYSELGSYMVPTRFLSPMAASKIGPLIALYREPESNHMACANSFVSQLYNSLTIFIFLFSFCSDKTWPPGLTYFSGKTISPTCAGHTFGYHLDGTLSLVRPHVQIEP